VEPRRIAPTDAVVMEPFLVGDSVEYREVTVKKWSWQCPECGLLWSIRWHAETCGSRNHADRWEQRYAYPPIVNGKPSRERFYPRLALGRLPVEAASPTARTFRFSAKVLSQDLVNVYSPRGGMVTVYPSQLPSSLGTRVSRAAWDCLPLDLTPAEATTIKSFNLRIMEAP
jgi:hypothetical protein